MARDIISRSSGDIMSVLFLDETLHRNQVKAVNISGDSPNSSVAHKFPGKMTDNELMKVIPEIELVLWGPKSISPVLE